MIKMVLDRATGLVLPPTAIAVVDKPLDRIPEAALRRLAAQGHWSTSDWDFGTTYWQLNATRYQSAPTSLYWTDGDYDYILLKQSSAGGKISQGQVDFWIYQTSGYAGSGGTYGSVVVMNSNPDGQAVYSNDYAAIRFQFATNSSDVYRWKGDGQVFTNLGSHGKNATAATWQKFRVRWWMSKNLQEETAMALQSAKWVDPDWQYGTILYDTEYISGKAYERIGFQCVDISAGHSGQWVDDVSVYRGRQS